MLDKLTAYLKRVIPPRNIFILYVIITLIGVLWFLIRPPLHHGLSLETFESAVEDPDDLMKFGGSETHVSHFVVSSPQLVNRYSQQLSQLECLNWSVPAAIPTSKRMFSIVENLKVCRCIKSLKAYHWKNRVISISWKSLRLPTNFHDTSNLLDISMVWKFVGNLLEVEISMIWRGHNFSSLWLL